MKFRLSSVFKPVDLNLAAPEKTGPKVRTSADRLIVAGTALLVSLFLVGGLWAGFASLSGAVIARGKIAIVGQPKTIQHIDGGIVAEISVSDGDLVRKGEALIRLDDTLLKTSNNIQQNQLRQLVARHARLVSERDQSETIRWDRKILALFAVSQKESIRLSQQKLFEARRDTRAGQVAQLHQKITQLEIQKSGVNASKKSKTKQIKILDEELTGLRKLSKDGLVAKSKLMAKERQREELFGKSLEFHAEATRIEISIAEIRIRILQIDRQFREEVLREIADVEREINDLVEKLQSTREQLKRVVIRSPVDGKVHDISVFTVGGVIGAENPIMKIVPQTGAFFIDALIEPQFVDEIHARQPVRLRFSAFNQEQMPEIDGYVEGVSADTITDDANGVAFYKLRIGADLKAGLTPSDQTLMPGMPVEAFIRTRERTLLSYLVQPFTNQITRAFREE